MRESDRAFSDDLYELLRVKGMTQRQLAREIGVNPSTVSDWVNGKSRPSLGNRRSVEELLRPREDMAAPEAAAGRPMPHTLRPGLTIDRYRLLRRLGRGASAEVWRAKVAEPISGLDLVTGQEVALKVYLPSLALTAGTLRIQREFLTAAEVEHPNLVDVFDVMISPSRPFHTFLVMELVGGRTLKDHIRRQGRFSPRRTASIGRQLFDALSVLHSAGALHRDVKAANIMLTGDTIKLMDFGIVLLEGDSFHTVGSMFLGSKHSAPFEQLTGGELDERADLYAAGTVLYHCLTGRPTYDRAGPEGAIVVRMLNDPAFIEWEAYGREAEPLVALINKCLELKAEDRPSSARDCVEELDAMSLPG